MRPDPEVVAHLYAGQRFSTPQIAAMYGVTRTTARRWVIAAGVARRPALGLANRGVTPPTADELRDMVHVQHLPYTEIGARYGVRGHSVMVWLKKHGIRRPATWETRKRGQLVRPTAGELRDLYGLGMSAATIGQRFNVSEHAVLDWLRNAGIERRAAGFDNGKRWACSDGHLVRSAYEQRVDDWLHRHGVAHEVEPRIPNTPYWRADFLARGTYIEIWGVTNRPDYLARKHRKRAAYAAQRLPLLEFDPSDFSLAGKGRWHRKLRRLLVASHQEVLALAARTIA